jgi:hypothetical protein
MANTRMQHENAYFSHITIHRFVGVLSDPDIDADITSMQRDNFHHTTIHEMHVCKLRNSNSSIFVGATALVTCISVRVW